MKVIEQIRGKKKELQSLVEKYGVNHAFQIVFNRIFLKTPFGNKVIHRPYHVTQVDKFLERSPSLFSVYNSKKK